MVNAKMKRRAVTASGNIHLTAGTWCPAPCPERGKCLGWRRRHIARGGTHLGDFRVSKNFQYTSILFSVWLRGPSLRFPCKVLLDSLGIAGNWGTSFPVRPAKGNSRIFP